MFPVAAWAELQAAAGSGSGTELWVAVADPCAQPTVAGWPARNLLWALAYHFRLTGPLTLLAYRTV